MDVSILEIGDGIFNVVCTYGNSHLGGEDLTNALTVYCIKEFEKANRITFDRNNGRAVWRVKNKCEEAKISLTSSNEVEIEVYNLMNEKDDLENELTEK